MFIKKAREFTGLWVFDKWKGYFTSTILLIWINPLNRTQVISFKSL